MANSDNRWMLKASQVWSIPLLILIATLIGLGLGRWLDGIFKSSPWLTIILTFVGLAAGLYESVKMLIDITRED